MSNTDKSDQLRVSSIQAWESWLEQNHQSASVAWLVFRKKGKGDVPFDYHMALDVALCYGWIDSLLKSIDENEYMRKFTPRKPTATWSEINKKKVELLSRNGKMKEAGLACIRVAKKNGMWDKGIKVPEVDDSLPGALLFAFQSNTQARDNYFALKQKKQQQYNTWINMAKRQATIQKRVEEALNLLEQGRELGLK